MSRVGVPDGEAEQVSGRAIDAGIASTPEPRLPWWQTLWPWFAAILSGVLLAISFPPWNQSGLIWFALTPLVVAVWFGGKPKPLRLGYVTGLVFFTLTFRWLSSLGELFSTPALYTLPFLLALYLALYPAIWAWFLARIVAPVSGGRLFPNSWRNLGAGALAASAWIALEWFRGWFLNGIGWNGLGVAFHRNLPMIQIAELTGMHGISWLIAFVNVMAVIIVRRIIGELGGVFLKRVRWEFSITVALVIGVLSYGARLLMIRPGPPTSTAKIAMVQPNIPQTEKFDPLFEDQVWGQLERLTGVAGASGPDLIIWPEAATPRGFFADQANFDFFQKLVQGLPCPLLAGTVLETMEHTESRSYNSAALFRNGEVDLPEPVRYDKMHLVPFGEYLPFRPVLGFIAGGLVPGDMDAGRNFVVMTNPKLGAFAPLICFEDTLGRLTRKFITLHPENPPRVFVNLTNDGWFLKTPAVEQHLANSVFRAVENRRPLLRCANTGVTGLISPNGEVDRWIEPHSQGVAIRRVEIRDAPLTFYTRHGDWIVTVSAALAGLAIVRRIARRRS